MEKLESLFVSEEARHRILNPEPGSALARARDYGIDLTLILQGVESSPEERLERAAQAQVLMRELRDMGRDSRNG